jgi:hypothetical protein
MLCQIKYFKRIWNMTLMWNCLMHRIDFKFEIELGLSNYNYTRHNVSSISGTKVETQGRFPVGRNRRKAPDWPKADHDSPRKASSAQFTRFLLNQTWV